MKLHKQHSPQTNYEKYFYFRLGDFTLRNKIILANNLPGRWKDLCDCCHIQPIIMDIGLFEWNFLYGWYTIRQSFKL